MRVHLPISLVTLPTLWREEGERSRRRRTKVCDTADPGNLAQSTTRTKNTRANEPRKRTKIQAYTQEKSIEMRSSRLADLDVIETGCGRHGRRRHASRGTAHRRRRRRRAGPSYIQLGPRWLRLPGPARCVLAMPYIAVPARAATNAYPPTVTACRDRQGWFGCALCMRPRLDILPLSVLHDASAQVGGERVHSINRRHRPIRNVRSCMCMCGPLRGRPWLLQRYP